MPTQYENKGPIDFKKSFQASADDFKDKSILITGAASGLGEAFTRELVKLGAYVTIADIQDEKGQKLAEELKPNAQFIHCDVTDFQSQIRAFEAAISNSPQKSLDHVLANAGIAGSDNTFDPEETPTEPTLSALNVNLTGCIYTCKLALHYFRTTAKDGDNPKDKSLLITSSLAGYLDLAISPVYNISKFGARAIMRTLRWKAVNRVNVLAPWFIKTPVMSDEIIAVLSSAGIGWATIEDATKGVIRVLADKEIDGRAVGVVPHDLVEGGLTDVGMDDYERGEGGTQEWMVLWQERLLKIQRVIEQMALAAEEK